MQFPDLNAYVQNRVRLANYDLQGLTIKLADTDDFQQLANTVDKFRDSSRIAERTRRGDVCVVAYKHGALAHARWAALSPIPAWGNYMVHLAPDEAYNYDSYTIPAFRRQGISSEAKVFLLAYLKQQGFRCTYGDSRMDNLDTQQTRIKKVREGRARVLGLIAVSTRLGWTRCTFFAETAATRPLVARLYRVPLQNIRIKSISQFLQEV
jgi:GNAT superfamily N-acetyltransferase